MYDEQCLVSHAHHCSLKIEIIENRETFAQMGKIDKTKDGHHFSENHW